MKTATKATPPASKSRKISIHAVMKTATLVDMKGTYTVVHFNPCSHEDCNPKVIQLVLTPHISIHAVMCQRQVELNS